MGVFQGSTLGPLLFTIFANDLSLHAPEAHVIQYADDTQILISDIKQNIPSLIQHMETTLGSLSSWFPRRALLAIVQSLVISRVRYCMSVYGNGSSANDTRLLKVVNFAT